MHENEVNACTNTKTKCIGLKLFDAKCTQLACLLSLASLLRLRWCMCEAGARSGALRILPEERLSRQTALFLFSWHCNALSQPLSTDKLLRFVLIPQHLSESSHHHPKYLRQSAFPNLNIFDQLQLTYLCVFGASRLRIEP